MDPAWITILVFLILIIVLIIFIVIIRHKSTDPPNIDSFLDQIPGLWGNPTNVPNGDRNTCGLYTFPGTMNGDGTFTPGEPTLNRVVLDAMTPGIFDHATCISPDQVVAQQQQRTCQPGDTGATGCYASDGSFVPIGGSEIIYVPCGVNNCTGSFGAIAVNFNPPPITGAYCLESNSQLQVSGVPCNLANLDQLWQIDRTSSSKFTPDPNGSYARIYSRSQQGCLQPLGSVVPGVPVGIGPCTQNSGYVWIIVGAQTFGDSSQSPQQIVYFPQWTTSVPPTFVSSYSLHRNTTTGGLELQPYAVYSSGITGATGPNIIPESEAVQFNAQILDYTLYNIIATIPTSEGYGFPPIPQTG